MFGSFFQMCVLLYGKSKEKGVCFSSEQLRVWPELKPEGDAGAAVRQPLRIHEEQRKV